MGQSPKGRASRGAGFREQHAVRDGVERDRGKFGRMNFPAVSSGVSNGNHLNRPKGRGIKPLSASGGLKVRKMLKWMNLRVRVFIALGALMFITFSGGLVMVWYTYRMDGLVTGIIERNMTALEAAQAMELALANQKGFVSYYFIDRDPRWLKVLSDYRQVFRAQLMKAHSLAETGFQRETIESIESQYARYTAEKDQVIALYKKGQREAGERLHKKVRSRFFMVFDLCERYKDFCRGSINKAKNSTFVEARRLRYTAISAILGGLFFAALLAFIFLRSILNPLRYLALQASQSQSSGSFAPEDEVKALTSSVHGLIKEFDQAQHELIKSKAHLIEAEKMALVGKLGAGTAHSIRNPLTSVKMRLFSLRRSLELSGPQQEDFDVISEEIGHIDNIVQNFLEFSRPPRLKLQRVSPSDIVDQALQLIRYRLESCEVEVTVQREKRLSETELDPEQLKEALINLLVNSCEAMVNTGKIRIHEEENFEDGLGQVAVIKLSDTGPGIPEGIREKVFEPFFTTKEEGSGLGLSIVARIIKEHGGKIDLESEQGKWSCFTITLPIKEPEGEKNPDH